METNVKLNTLIQATAATVLIAASTSTLAEHQDYKDFYITGGINHFMFAGDRNIENDETLFFGGGYQYKPDLAFELNYITGETESDNRLVDVDISMLSAMAIYRFKPVFEDTFTLRGGLSYYDLDDYDETKDLAIRLGVGYEKYLTSNLALSAFVDFVTDTYKVDTDTMPSIGLTYYFGSGHKHTKPAPKAKPVAAPALDSDKDGVIDANDQCPTTVAGAQVDTKGCELDSDNDGVKNSADQCPTTITGVEVNGSGCELDTDQDGIVNRLDKCLTTPKGAKVDGSGCQVKLKKEVSFNLKVEFANNSLEVQPAYKENIDELAKFLIQYPSSKVVIEGHTDDRGAASYNQSLSEKRAQAIVDYIVKNYDVDVSRVTAIGKGESAPIADNNTAAGRQANRRVVAVVKAAI